MLTTAKANLNGLPPFKVVGSYSWVDENTLELVLRYIESPHSERLIFSFDNNNVTVEMQNSFDYGTKKTILKGEK